MEGAIADGDESAYRQEVDCLVSWCRDNSLELNTSKTKEMIVDFRRNPAPIDPLFIDGQAIERVDTFKFLGSHISSDLSWDNNTDSIIKRAQQRLYFLRQLKKFGLSKDILRQFYRAVVESVLTFSITVWFNSATKQQRDRLESVVRTAGKIVGSDLPTLESIYTKRIASRAWKIAADSSHPGCSLFESLPSGRRYRSIRTRTCRFQSSFFPQAISALNLKAPASGRPRR